MACVALSRPRGSVAFPPGCLLSISAIADGAVSFAVPPGFGTGYALRAEVFEADGAWLTGPTTNSSIASLAYNAPVLAVQAPPPVTSIYWGVTALSNGTVTALVKFRLIMSSRQHCNMIELLGVDLWVEHWRSSGQRSCVGTRCRSWYVTLVRLPACHKDHVLQPWSSATRHVSPLYALQLTVAVSNRYSWDDGTQSIII